MTTLPKIALIIAAAALLASSTVAFGQGQGPFVGSDSARTFQPTGETGQMVSNGILRVPTAKLVCVHNVKIAAQSDGLILNLFADKGKVVKKGDPLLKIDNRVAEAELEVASKELEAALKQAAQTAEVEYAKKASLVADEEYKAENELLGKGSSTFSQAMRKKLEAERSRLGIDVAVVKHENEGLAADVAQAKLDAARVRLDLYDVTAPYDGVIVERLRDEGEYIRSGEPILRLTHMNEIEVEANVSVLGISPWQLENAPIKVIVPMNSQQSLERESTITFVSTEITQNYVRISAKIPNERIGESWLLRDGMTATVEIQVLPGQ
jgi:multidrug efflux pump subunit AcrA (membrane-fusion protein)